MQFRQRSVIVPEKRRSVGLCLSNSFLVVGHSYWFCTLNSIVPIFTFGKVEKVNVTQCDVSQKISQMSPVEVLLPMRQVPLEHDINIAVNGCSWFATSTQKGPLTAMFIV